MLQGKLKPGASVGGNVRGIMWMAATAALLPMMHSLVRGVSQTLDPFIVIFFRNLIPFFLLLPFMFRPGRATWRTAQPGMQVVRCVLGVGGMTAWFISLSFLPVAEATALSFTSTIFATLGAGLLLREQVTKVQMMAVAVGFVGALIILRPGFGVSLQGATLVLVSSVLWALGILFVKVLARTDSNMTIVFWSSLLMTPMSLIPALFVWRWPTGMEWGFLAGIGLLATGAHLAFAQALRSGDAAALMPVDFTRLIWAGVIGYLLFSELPDHWTLIGGGVIFASSMFLTLRERSRSRHQSHGPAG